MNDHQSLRPPLPSDSVIAGRFAPSPTGPLHFGSLIAALGSFLEAKAQGGTWLVRIEDIDTPRVVPGAADNILRTLEMFGMNWDGPVVYQSQRVERYREALTELMGRGLAYPCSCSRREITRVAARGASGMIYPGTCRRGPRRVEDPKSIRLRTDNRVISFKDEIQGPVDQRVESEVGDFVVRRMDGLFAYQLAVVVDDADQGVTQVVRGSDLLHSTPRQIYLQGLLGLSTPRYGHLPLALDRRGDKLSKQTQARAVNSCGPGQAISAALTFLNQSPPADLTCEPLETIWNWALRNWRPDRVPSRMALGSSPAASKTRSNESIELARSTNTS